MDIRNSKNFLLSEIKVINPVPTIDMFNKINQSIYNIMNSLNGSKWLILDKEYFKIINKFTKGFGFEWHKLSDIEKTKIYHEMKKLLNKYTLDEDISNFNIGQTSETGGRKTTVTDVDPETQSVTWSVKKEIDDSDIYKDLSLLIKKFESVQLKDFHSRPKLIQLVKDLKSIRNKFSRTVIKEEKIKYAKQMIGLLNEIKVKNNG